MTAHEFPGPACWCGKRGCLETFLSGPAIAKDHQQAAGTFMTARDIAAAAEAGDKAAIATLERFENRLARALAGVINVLNPAVIVLGGGLSNLDRLYQNVPTLWQSWVFSDAVTTRLVQAEHGDSSGVRGAAWLWAPPSFPRVGPTP